VVGLKIKPLQKNKSSKKLFSKTKQKKKCREALAAA